MPEEVDNQAEAVAADVESESSEEEVVENDSQEHEEVPEEVDETKGQIAALAQANADLTDKFNRFLDSQNAQAAAKSQAKQPSDTELADQWNGGDAFGAVNQLIDKKVSARGKAIEASTRADYEKQHWSDKTEKDFPVEDKAFMAKVQKEWNSRVSKGFISGENPRDAYAVCEIVALKTGQNKGGVRKVAASGEQPRTAVTQKSNKVDLKDPSLKLYATSLHPDKYSKEQRDRMIKSFAAKMAASKGRKR